MDMDGDRSLFFIITAEWYQVVVQAKRRAFLKQKLVIRVQIIKFVIELYKLLQAC